jgi:hypothetical protein
VEEGDQETSNDVPVFQEVEWDQRVWSKLLFVYCEADHGHGTEDEEDDAVGYVSAHLIDF